MHCQIPCVLMSVLAASHTVSSMQRLNRFCLPSGFCQGLSPCILHVNTCRTDVVSLFIWPAGHMQMSCLTCTASHTASSQMHRAGDLPVFVPAANAVCMLIPIDSCDMCLRICLTVKHRTVHVSLCVLSTHGHLWLGMLLGFDLL